MKKSGAVIISALLGLPVSAQAEDVVSTPFYGRAVAFVSDLDTKVRIDPQGSTLPGTAFSFEDDIGLSRGRTIPSFELGYHFAPDWRVEFEYFNIDRKRRARLQDELQFGDANYAFDAEVEGRLASDLYKVQLGWLPVRRDGVEWGLTAGVHLSKFTASLKGEARLNDAETGVHHEVKKILAPLPTIGTFGRFKVTDEVQATGKLNWLKLAIGDYKGGLTDVEGYVHWQIFNHIGIGAGYRLLKYDLIIKKQKYMGALTYRFSGPTMFLTARF